MRLCCDCDAIQLGGSWYHLHCLEKLITRRARGQCHEESLGVVRMEAAARLRRLGGFDTARVLRAAGGGYGEGAGPWGGAEVSEAKQSKVSEAIVEGTRSHPQAICRQSAGNPQATRRQPAGNPQTTQSEGNLKAIRRQSEASEGNLKAIRRQCSPRCRSVRRRRRCLGGSASRARRRRGDGGGKRRARAPRAASA